MKTLDLNMYMYVYECIHIKKFKSEILGFGSTEEIVHVYQYMYQKKKQNPITDIKYHYK